jgi:hypothetical protein
MDGWDSGFGMFRRLAESRSEGWTRDGVGWVTGWVEMGFSGGTKPSCFFVFNEMVGSFRNFTLFTVTQPLFGSVRGGGEAR